jgi:hypothetical protein
MTTPNEADEATPTRPKAAASGEANNVEILAQVDSKAARILAKAEAKRIEAAAKTEAKDHEAARLLGAEAASLESAGLKAARKQAKADNRAAQVAEGRARMMASLRAAFKTVRSEAASSYAGFIYLVVVSVAIGSQFVFFKRLIDSNEQLSTLQAVSGFAALLAALFVEGFGLAFYATSVASRLRNRGGWVPRILAWLVTGFAAWLQFQAHRDLLFLEKPLLSYACAAASVGAMLLAEVRTTYKVGETLEELDQKDRPQARLGVKFCLRYPRTAWWALSAMIANPAIRTRSTALKAGQKLAELRDEAELNNRLKAEAKRALRAAQKKEGTSEAILARLEQMAHYGAKQLAAQARLAQAPTFLVAQGFIDEATNQLASEAWAERPNGPEGWGQRIAELAQVFPREKGALPSRAVLIETMKLRALDPDLPPLRYAWTNKGYVGQASKDLADLRDRGYPDPQLTEA